MQKDKILSSEHFMNMAIMQAEKAGEKGDVPIGCVIVKDNKIIARGYNKREKKKNSIAHAEIVAINKACKKLRTWKLQDCEIYVTMQPCLMCAGAIINSRIKKLYYGLSDDKPTSTTSYFNENSLNHKVEIESGLLADECKKLLQDFFINLRKNKKRD